MAENACTEEKSSNFGVRHLQCFLVFCGLSVAYAIRVNLAVAIVAMMDKNSTNPDFSEYHWSEKTKSLLLSSFFAGYIITQVPGGQLSRRFGGKVMLFYSVLISSLLALLTPHCAELNNWQLLCALRALQGISQGVIFPSIHTILAKWSPVLERDILGTYCYSGAPFGTVVMLAISGVIAASSLGWPCLFYLPGIIGVLWSISWLCWGADSPRASKSISVAERRFIEESLQESAHHEEDKQALKTPWKAIFSSVPFLVLTLQHCAFTFGFWLLLTQIPTYMKNILQQDIKSNALLSALPYLVMFLLGFVFCGVSNLLRNYKCLSLSASRKLFNTIGIWLPAATLVGFSYVGADQRTLAVVLLTLTIGLTAAIHLGFQVNHIDLTPNFAGTLMGITNSAANCMSTIAPLVVGYFVSDVKNPYQWRIVFFIGAGYFFIGNLLFLIFGQAKVQPWNNTSQTAPELKPIKGEEGIIIRET